MIRKASLLRVQSELLLRSRNKSHFEIWSERALTHASSTCTNTSARARTTGAILSEDGEHVDLYDATVIGLGGVGSFALRSLVKKEQKERVCQKKGHPKSQPLRILGLERFELSHTHGSSHGDSRLYRHAYFEHINYVPLCIKSTDMFQELCDSTKERRERLDMNNKIRKENERVHDGDENQHDYNHVPLLERCGVLIMSDRRNEREGTDEDEYKAGRFEFIERCRASAEKYKIDHEILNHEDLKDRYGQMFDFDSKVDNDIGNSNVTFSDRNGDSDSRTSTRRPNEYQGILEPGAGYVRPELALQYAIEEAKYYGAKIVTNTQVTSIQRTRAHCINCGNDEKGSGNDNREDIIRIQTQDGKKYYTRAVLISAGAWASQLIPQWTEHLKVTRQIQTWFEPKVQGRGEETTQRKLESPNVMFQNGPGWFIDRVSQPLALYGFPMDQHYAYNKNNRSKIKIALHGRDIPFDPDEYIYANTGDTSSDQEGHRDVNMHMSRPQVTEEEVEELRSAVEGIIPEAAENGRIRVENSKACLYTMSPDGHFMVDRIDVPFVNDKDNNGGDTKEKISSPNVWCVAGLSGHGFKMVPALGQAMADMIMDGDTDLPIDFLKVDAKRFKDHRSG